MILNEGKAKWYYLAVKRSSVFLHGKSSKHGGDFYCLNCIHSFRAENKFKSHEMYIKIKISVEF